MLVSMGEPEDAVLALVRSVIRGSGGLESIV
jgi:hypothetical protein